MINNTTFCDVCNQPILKFRIQEALRHQSTIKFLYGYDVNSLKTRNRDLSICYARFHYWFLLVVESIWSFPEAGKSTGHKHHAVMYGVNKIAVDLLGLPNKSSLEDIRYAYWRLFNLKDNQIKALILSKK